MTAEQPTTGAPSPEVVADEWAAVAATLAPVPAAVAAAAEPLPPAAPVTMLDRVRSSGRPAPVRVLPSADAAPPAPAAAAASTGGTSAPQVAPDQAPAVHRAADLRLAMADPGARRDLRRILIAFGAIGKPRTDGRTGTPARPEDVVGAFMTATAPMVDALLRNAGAIRDEARLVRFVDAIAEVCRRSDPADPKEVVTWINSVAAILRDDASWATG